MAKTERKRPAGLKMEGRVGERKDARDENRPPSLSLDMQHLTFPILFCFIHRCLSDRSSKHAKHPHACPRCRLSWILVRIGRRQTGFGANMYHGQLVRFNSDLTPNLQSADPDDIETLHNSNGFNAVPPFTENHSHVSHPSKYLHVTGHVYLKMGAK